ncbi:hypothetical protein [Kutzneria kofuensis]|uniref:hypothetical protein n=1 Tax=Kutzneria kofuensis TaxID=103725 RepID=UPI0031E8E81F
MPSNAGPAVKVKPGADASFSGAPNTLPAAMLDGVTTSGGWSNYYSKAATALLPAVSKAHAGDWVSESWSAARQVGEIGAYFTVDAVHSLPASIRVSWWDGQAFVPVTNPKITWAAGSNQPTRVPSIRCPPPRSGWTWTAAVPAPATGSCRSPS